MEEIKWSHKFTNAEWKAIAGALMMVEITLRPLDTVSDTIGKKLAMQSIGELMNEDANALAEIIAEISGEGIERTLPEDKESIG